jgi:hypothetical protein
MEYEARLDLGALIRATPRRSEQENDLLLAALLDPCWPSGPSDRADVAGRETLRRTGPTRLRPVVLRCSCALGRCRVFN